MRLKKGVTLEGITAPTKNAVEIVNAIYLAYGQDLVITSGSEGSPDDGVHLKESKHYTGEAFDCRIRSILKEMIEPPIAPDNTLFQRDMRKVRAIVKAIRDDLGPDFDVVLEKDHIHVEFDPRSTAGVVARDLKRFVDLVAKFIGDMMPFYRMVQRWWKSRK